MAIKPQDFIVIIGDVGSGKTVLLDCLADQLEISSGAINMNSPFSYLEQ